MTESDSAIQTIAPQVVMTTLRLRFDVSPERRPQKWTTDKWIGSLWRGCFGKALRTIACVTRLDDCKPCILRSTCVYPELFLRVFLSLAFAISVIGESRYACMNRGASRSVYTRSKPKRLMSVRLLRRVSQQIV